MKKEDAKLLCGQLLFVAALILSCLAGFHACRKSYENVKPEPAAVAPAKLVRSIPLSAFKSTAGMKVGARIQAATAGGGTFTGTIVEIGKDSVSVEVDSAK